MSKIRDVLANLAGETIEIIEVSWMTIIKSSKMCKAIDQAESEIKELIAQAREEQIKKDAEIAKDGWNSVHKHISECIAEQIEAQLNDHTADTKVFKPSEEWTGWMDKYHTAEDSKTLTLCPHCNCMTKTVDGKCGKCGKSR